MAEIHEDIKTEIHDNEFEFKAGPGVYELKFQYDGDHCVTDNQPWDGVIVDGGRITVKAGRKGSTKCADYFANSVGGNVQNMVHTNGGSHKPKELNFAIKGTLTVNGEENEVCIGQGHREGPPAVNNWHIASKSIIADDDGENGALGYRMVQDGTHAFDLSKG